MAERIPPHSDDAEKSVLGACLLSKDALLEVTDRLKAADFYSAAHREIYIAILELYRRNEPVDMLTVSEELLSRKVLDMVGGRVYLAQLTEAVPSTANAGQYAKIVAEKAIMRRLIDASSSIMEQSFQEKVEADTALDQAEQKIFEIAQSRNTKEVAPLRDVLVKNIEIIDEATKRGGDVVGIPTGFTDLDKLLSGMQKSDLIIVAARPAMGKTAFALNIAQQAALKGNATVLMFTMEMAKEQLGQRLLSMEARIESQKLKTGSLTRKDWDDLNLAIDTLSKAKIFIDETPNPSIIEIKNKCRRLKAESGLDLVVLDYLQLMSIDGRTESRVQEISALSRQLKQVAREMECPVIVLSQLSRGPEMRADHRPQLSDLRESGSIEQDADIVMFLYRDDYYTKENSEKPGVCEVIVAKHRSGPTGTIELTWLEKYTRFVDKSNLSINDFAGE